MALVSHFLVVKFLLLCNLFFKVEGNVEENFKAIGFSSNEYDDYNKMETPETNEDTFRRNYMHEAKISKSRNLRQKEVQDPSKVDFAILVDEYSKKGRQSFDFRKRIIKELLGYLPIFPNRVRVAAVSVSSKVTLEFDFKESINKECALKRIDKIRYREGLKTLLSDGLNYVVENVIFNSDRNARSNAMKIIAIFSERVPDVEEKRRWKNILHQLNVELIFIKLRKIPAHFQTLRLPSELRNTFKRIGSLLGTEIPLNCKSGKIVYDQCKRRCKCVHGKLVDCCRIRKPFTEMSEEERKRYIQVIKTASTHAHFIERYEALLTTHKTLFRTGIHQQTFFLPWHRWFILQYENLLREIDCSVTVPYWESAEEANDALSSDVWNTAEHGLGGNGTGSSGCVRDGPFRAEVWSVIESAGGGCLTRNFNGRYPDCVAVMQAILEFSNASKFEDFEYFLHREFHDAVHCAIGGLMCTDNSAAAPEFFLHHGFVDKLWSDWQRQSREHTVHDHFVSQKSPMPGTDLLSKDLLDLRHQPECVCVKYRDPDDSVYRTLMTFSMQQIVSMPRVKLPPYPEHAKKLFRISERDMKRMERVRSFLQPINELRESDLTGRDRILGFKKEDLMREWERGLQKRRLQQSSDVI